MRKEEMNMQLPSCIQFETNVKCNQHCIFCPHDQMKTREQASDELISKIIKECVPTATTVYPFQMQDPLLEQRLRKILAEIKRTNWKAKTIIYTSIHNADMKEMRKIITDGTLNEINVSMYGEKYQLGLNIKKAKHNLTEIIRHRNSECRKTPTIIMQWISDLENKNEIQDMCDIADGTQNVPYNTFHGTITPPRNRTRGPAIHRKPCARLWEQFNVHSNGNVVPCCLDFNGEIVLGNMKTQSAMEIWNGDKFNTLREMHVQRRFNEIELCKNCMSWEWL